MRCPRAAIILVILAVSFSPARAQTGSSTVVISQLYGGGGNVGATLRNDFVELFNRGAVSVNITGWSVQYASSSGSAWDRTILSGTIAAGQYYLIQEAQGNGGSVSLPNPDASGGINLSATSGKVALVTDSNPLTSASPAGSNLADFVGYGNGSFAEGLPTPDLSNTTAAVRNASGCTDTNSNLADFSITAPNPRNSSSSRNPCAGSPGPQISQAGVTNAATFLSGPIAPGEIVTIFGSGMGPTALAGLQLTPDLQHVIKSLAGVRVLFDGVPGAMIYARADQLSVIVPYAASLKTSVGIQVEYNGRLSNQITVPVSAAAPGIFTADSSGRGAGAILTPDYRLNGPSNRAPPGSIVLIYATGEGQTNPGGDDGKIVGADLPRPVQFVSVRMGGIEAEVLYAGGAPGLVSGVLQVNARIPDSLAATGEVPLVLSIGNSSSQTGVTVFVGPPPTGDGTGPLIEEKLASSAMPPSHRFPRSPPTRRPCRATGSP
jgi:uncharacterized protein (TIGR03437 family)